MYWFPVGSKVCTVPGTKYKANVKCNPHCHGLSLPNNGCDDYGVPGCVCPKGMALSGSKCVQVSDCPCHFGSDVYQPNEWHNDTCQSWYVPGKIHSLGQ